MTFTNSLKDTILENDDFSSLKVKREGSPSLNSNSELYEDQVSFY